MVPRSRPAPRTTGPSRRRPADRWYRWHVAEPPHPRTGDPHSGANRGSTATARPTPSPTAHLAGQRAASRYVVFRPSFNPSPSRRALGRNLALDLRRGDRRRRDRGAHHRPAADDRPARRPRADRPGRAGRGAVRRQPAGRLRRSVRAAVRRPAGAAPRRRRRVAPARCSSCRTPPVMIAVAIVFWLSLSFGGPFHLRLWGVDVPGPAASGGSSGSSGWAAPRPAPLAAFAGGLIADRLGGPSRRRAGRRRRGRLRDRLRGPARPVRRAAAVVLGPRIDPRPARAAGPRQGRAGPGVLRRRPHRGGAAVRAGPRRPAGPEAVRRRRHRHPGRGRDDGLVPGLGRRGGSARRARGAAPRQRRSGCIGCIGYALAPRRRRPVGHGRRLGAAERRRSMSGSPRSSATRRRSRRGRPRWPAGTRSPARAASRPRS